jgi:transposase
MVAWRRICCGSCPETGAARVTPTGFCRRFWQPTFYSAPLKRWLGWFRRRQGRVDHLFFAASERCHFGRKCVLDASRFVCRQAVFGAMMRCAHSLPGLDLLVEPLLVVRRALREQIGILHPRLLAIVRDDDVCRRLMTVPGVGPVVALTYRATSTCPLAFGAPSRSGCVRIDTLPAPVRRERSPWRDLAVRRRDDAGDSL